MTGKISRLPWEIREQVNRRMANGQTDKIILPWLNGLPEVQQILKDQFDAEPITEQNLSAYRKFGFRRWELRQNALDFAAEAEDDSRAAAHNGSAHLGDHLVHFATLRFASAAHSTPIPEDPEADLRQAHRLVADVVALRRGDLAAKRLALELKRLALEETQSQEHLDKLFWEWTKRPDINKRLYPHHDPDKECRAVVRMVDKALFGISPRDDDPEPDPAAWI